MTEREKMAQIIAEYLCPQGKAHKTLYGEARRCYSRDNFANCERVSECVDALIAAGIGDVKEAKKEAEYCENEAKTARADIDDAVKEITKRIFCELRNWFAEQSAYAVDYNQHLGYYDYKIKASDVVCDIVEIAEKYGVELGAKYDD